MVGGGPFCLSMLNRCSPLTLASGDEMVSTTSPLFHPLPILLPGAITDRGTMCTHNLILFQRQLTQARWWEDELKGRCLHHRICYFIQLKMIKISRLFPFY